MPSSRRTRRAPSAGPRSAANATKRFNWLLTEVGVNPSSLMSADESCQNLSVGAQRSQVASPAGRLDSSWHLADAYRRPSSSCIWVARELTSDGAINRTTRAGLVGVADSVPAGRLELRALVGRHSGRARVRCRVRVVRSDDVAGWDVAQVRSPGSERLTVSALRASRSVCRRRADVP